MASCNSHECSNVLNTLKPRSHVKVVIYRTWAIFPLSLVTIPESQFGQCSKVVNDLTKDSPPMFVCRSSFFLSLFLQDAKQQTISHHM